MKKFWLGILIIVVIIGMAWGGLIVASNILLPDKQVSSEAQYFYNAVKKLLDSEQEEVAPETLTNFEWDYICVYGPYGIRAPTDIKVSNTVINVTLDDIPMRWSESYVVIYVNTHTNKTTYVNAHRLFNFKQGGCYSKKSIMLKHDGKFLSIINNQPE